MIEALANESLGYLALSVWLFIFFHGTKIPSRIISPHSLFALGILGLYVVPGIYWSLREWPYGIANYQDGVPKVQMIALLFGLPIFAYRLCRRGAQRVIMPLEKQFTESLRFAGWSGMLFFFLAMLGFAWRIYLFSLGHQGRFEREDPTLFGSADLGFLAGNIGFLSRIFYFAMLLTANKFRRRIAYCTWGLDGLLQVLSLHRYAMLIFLFHSLVFLCMRGFAFTIRRLAVLASAVILTVTVVGYAAVVAPDFLEGNRSYIGPSEVLTVLSTAFSTYSSGSLDRAASGAVQSDADSFMLRAIDDTMFRLYESRSAAAVVPNYPDTYPFLEGETLYPMVFALIPRFFWPGKPEMRNAHLLTFDFMPNDSGLNPLGTLADLYVNGGYVLVFVGGLIGLLILNGLVVKLSTTNVIERMAFSVVYPLIGELLVGANRNVSQRISEGLRLMVVYIFIYYVLKWSYRGMRAVSQARPVADIESASAASAAGASV